MRRFAPAVLAVAVLAACSKPPTQLDPTPIEIRADPGQRTTADPRPMRFEEGGWTWTITPRAEYVLQGVVVGRERYRFDFNAKVSPCDLALAWGPLASHEAFDDVTFDQGGRFYFWRTGVSRPIEEAIVARFSANVHLVPAHPSLGRVACGVRPGQRVALAGDLVDIEGRRGDRRFSWKTSLVRTDTGNGACELLYLRRIKVGGRVYD